MNKIRNGAMTSSEIVALMSDGREKGSFGKPFYTYVEEINMERRLNRALVNESDARPTSWGNLAEKHVFSLLGLEYRLCSEETIAHPTIPGWVGSPDGIKEDAGRTVMDIKSPITLKSFCQLVDPLYSGKTGMDAMKAIRDNHKDGDKFYFQLVSNAILTKSKWAELIIFAPYKSELGAIREMASQIDDPAEQRKYYWIAQADDEYLPWLEDGGFYKNLNVIRWEVPDSEKWLLIERVKKAGEKLIQV